MSEPRFRPATRDDIDTLVPIVREFYADEGIPWDEAMLREALDALLRDPANGRLLLIERDGVLAGYIVIGFCFSLEFGGRYGLLDELYVRPAQRGGGLGKYALAEVEAVCRRQGLRAVRLEVSNDNEHAHGIYQRSGYDAHPRRLMTRWLDENA